MTGVNRSSSFHTAAYQELLLPKLFGTPAGEKRETRQLVVRERELRYRLSTHAHPYVGALTRRLLDGGVPGLQAADTEYVPGGVLPYSTEVAVADAAPMTLPVATRVELTADTPARLPGGATVTLVEGLGVPVAGSVPATLVHGARLTLARGLPGHEPGEPAFELAGDVTGEMSRDAELTVPFVTAVRLLGGGVAELPAGTSVLLRAGTPLTVRAGTRVTLLAARPLPVYYRDLTSPTAYDPSALVRAPHPVSELDFGYSGAYSDYNWELFFHIPMLIAQHLTRSGHYREAQRWLHVIYDPTDASETAAPARFWHVRPFQETDVRRISDIMVNLATGLDPELREETLLSIQAWRQAPFRPHVVARYRPQAYMIKTITAYLDNLIAWGDSLFRRDTGEAVDEAMMVYVLAANILGPKPQAVPKKGTVRRQTYASLRGDLDRFGNAMREFESAIAFDSMPFPSDPTASAAAEDRLTSVRSLGKALYFCVPRNDKLLGYWDTVADRLFKIRNSLNLQGVFRRLALFEPPIDPALLARAAAAGLDVGSIVNGLNQPLPLVRFAFLAQKAAELTGEVKALGANLLSALEKQDGEALQVLRARHELAMMRAVEQVKYGQHQEAIRNREGVEKSLTKAVQTYVYHQRLLGVRESDITLPDLAAGDFAFDGTGIAGMSFSSAEPELPTRPVPVDIAGGGSGSTGDATLGLLGAGDITGGKLMNSFEKTELDNLEVAQGLHDVAQLLALIGKGMIVIPEFGVKFHFWGLGGDFTFGGKQLAEQAKLGADQVSLIAGRFTYEARRAEKLAQYANRERDWIARGNEAVAEINQIAKQVRAAQIREAVAELELTNQRTQIKNAQEVEYFLTGEKNPEWTQKVSPTERKRAGRDLYSWLQREVRGLHSQAFQFAFDLARKAERALQHELGDTEQTYLQFSYLEGKEGLLAGERLALDIKRMELAYHERNAREYELTRHVSLMAVDPTALLKLRRTGRCTVTLPEALFDIDGPGHYFRRVRSVALSLPCVTGPYTSVNCRLTLLRSSIRTTDELREGEYARQGADDSRFSDAYGAVQSIVTSTGSNDSGLFDATGGRDDRYVPFEYAGAISEWQLELPADPSKGEPRQFDFDTISDAVLHLRYTAREGGERLRRAATTSLTDAIGAASVANTRLFSVRGDFPTEWARLRAQTPPAGGRRTLTVTLREAHYPFWSTGRLSRVTGVRLFAHQTRPTLTVFDGTGAGARQDVLARDPGLGNLVTGRLTNVKPAAAPVGEFTVHLESADFDDLWFAVDWAGPA